VGGKGLGSGGLAGGFSGGSSMARLGCTGCGSGLGSGTGCVMVRLSSGGGGGFSVTRVMGARNWYTTSRVTCTTGVVCRMSHSSAMWNTPLVSNAGMDMRCCGGSVFDSGSIIV
jgi:hypothetical protein